MGTHMEILSFNLLKGKKKEHPWKDLMKKGKDNLKNLGLQEKEISQHI